MTMQNMSYLYLAIAIVAEVTATSALKASEEFTRLVPSLVVVVGCRKKGIKIEK